MSQKIVIVPIQNLHLWTENPRDPMDTSFSDYDIIKHAVKDKKTKWDLPKLLKNMGTHYDFSELPTVVKKNGKYIVYDGNRRIAVLKYLQNKNIYSAFGGGLFPDIEPKELIDLKEIPCNVCSVEIALDNIERKHLSTGSWSVLDRDFFAYKHRGQKKSIFVMFEELTGLISANDSLNQRFVKDEVLTEKNLKSIGFHLENDILFSVYDKIESEKILSTITELIETGTISTRNVTEKGKIRIKSGDLGKVVKEQSGIKIEEFDKNKSNKLVSVTHREHDNTKVQKNIKKTPIYNPYKKDMIFGRILQLKQGSVNNLYSAIYTLYEKVKTHDKLYNFLPIFGMSLRLILDIAGREYFKNDPEKLKKDQLWKEFIKKVKNDFKQSKKPQEFNYISLGQGWLNNNEKFEAPLGKWAHGTLPSTREDILQVSYIVADILEFYFEKEK